MISVLKNDMIWGVLELTQIIINIIYRGGWEVCFGYTVTGEQQKMKSIKADITLFCSCTNLFVHTKHTLYTHRIKEDQRALFLHGLSLLRNTNGCVPSLCKV